MNHSHFFEFTASPVMIGSKTSIKGILCVQAGISVSEVIDYCNQQSGLGNPGPYVLGNQITKEQRDTLKDVNNRSIEEASKNYSGAKFFGFITDVQEK